MTSAPSSIPSLDVAPPPERAPGRAPAPRVFINGRFLTQRTTGIQRYAREVLSALDALVAAGEGPDARLEVLAPPGAERPALRAIGYRQVGRLTGHAWEQVTLPAVSGGDLLYSFGPTGPLVKRRQVVTIHDASVYAVPQAFTWRFRAWYKLALGVLARRAQRIVTVSRFSQGEIRRYFGGDPSRLRVTVEGWQHILREPSDPAILARHGLRAGRYLLAVSSPTPNKNFGLVVAALRHVGAAPPFDVVIAGARHEGVFAREAGAASSAIKHVGYVSDRELRALYEHAGAFVYPSLYEGFGLPPIEAMASGCPVIASSAASLPEVCGDAAVYVSPHDPIELAAAIVRVMSDEDERRRLATRGHARVQAYSWEAAARAHVDCIRDCLAESSSGPGAPGGRRWFRLPRPVFS